MEGGIRHDDMPGDELAYDPYMPVANNWMAMEDVEPALNNYSDNDSLATWSLAEISSISSHFHCGEKQEIVPIQTIAEEQIEVDSDSLVVGWSLLPHAVLSEIFRHLKDRDRINAARVCKFWKLTLKDPSLWRSQHWRFSSTSLGPSYHARVLAYARKYGHHMHNLSIQCIHPSYSVAKRFQSSMTAVLHALNTKARRSDCHHCELRKLTLNQLHIERYWRNECIRDRLVVAICRFLKDQRRLKFCDLSEETFAAQDGLRILDALGDASGSKVQLLNIEDFFAVKLPIYNVPRFRLIMSSFHNLHSLITNYNYLSEDLVDQLTANCARKLECLNIKVYGLDSCRHTIPPYSWHRLCRACPELRVSLYFEAVCAYTDLTRIACHELPLKVVHIWTGMNKQEEYWRLSDTIRYLGKTFSKYLEEACFNFENYREEIDDALLNFLSKTHRLETLDMQGVIQVPTIATICDWQEQYKICLQRFHVSADSLTGMEVEDLYTVVDKYSGMLYQRGHDFQLLANPGF